MSSKRRLRKNACDGKIKHKSMGDAITAAKKTGKIYGDRKKAYKCRFCRQYHIGG